MKKLLIENCEACPSFVGIVRKCIPEQRYIRTKEIPSWCPLEDEQEGSPMLKDMQKIIDEAEGDCAKVISVEMPQCVGKTEGKIIPMEIPTGIGKSCYIGDNLDAKKALEAAGEFIKNEPVRFSKHGCVPQEFQPQRFDLGHHGYINGKHISKNKDYVVLAKSGGYISKHGLLTEPIEVDGKYYAPKSCVSYYATENLDLSNVPNRDIISILNDIELYKNLKSLKIDYKYVNMDVANSLPKGCLIIRATDTIQNGLI